MFFGFSKMDGVTSQDRLEIQVSEVIWNIWV